MKSQSEIDSIAQQLAAEWIKTDQAQGFHSHLNSTDGAIYADKFQSWVHANKPELYKHILEFDEVYAEELGCTFEATLSSL